MISLIYFGKNICSECNFLKGPLIVAAYLANWSSENSLSFVCFYLASEGSFSDTEKLMLIEQCSGPSSCCDHASSFLRLELQRAGYSPHSGRKFGQ